VDSDATVHIVDDDPAVRQSMNLLVKSMGLRPQAFASAREFLDQCDGSNPGCVLLDLRMPGISGMELLELMDRHKMRLPVIIISAHGDVPTAVRALRGGALNFLEKPCRDQQLWEAIQEALRHDMQCRREMAQRRKVRSRLERLTEGECEVLDRLIEGKPNKEIAAELDLSVRTIEVRRAKLMDKMEAGSLAELVRMTIAARPELAAPAQTEVVPA